ncbi:diguanylate cyclase [Paraglaciecola sp. 2405UD69-4]|uniref:diguanylate cyclase n=1 Tax=Paraglaciecola sp. 2405UD69-4 TaxID=3391836 RepID=UPI0039C9C28C
MTESPMKDRDATILIVDDDPLIVVTATKALDSLGKVVFALNGTNALKLANEQLPDVILLDEGLPDMTGFEVCSALKANPTTASIPIIFVTSRSEDGFEEKVFDQGAADYISKPINPRVMVARASLQLNYVKALRSLEYLTLTDALTGLHNRRSFDAKFNMEFKRAKRSKLPISVLMIDIDQFKKYNDHFGHIVGDLCIQKVAQILLDAIGRPTDFIARYGGEEFVVVLPDTGIKGAQHFADRLLQDVVDSHIPHAPDSLREMVTVSIGYHSVLPNHDDKAVDLLDIADNALFEAKNNGRACAYTIK